MVDLVRAPRNSEGLVEYSLDFYILKPAELTHGNRRLLYDVVNRGNKRALQFFNDAPPSNAPRTTEDAGNGFLMRRGYTVVWSAWQGDILPIEGRMTMDLPVAFESGHEIVGTLRAEFIADQPGTLSYPLNTYDYLLSYESTSLDTTTATFTCRQYEGDPRQPIPSHAWQFAKPSSDGKPIPSSFHCYLPEGFRPGWIYELIYTAKNPLVLGLGFTGVRDLICFLRTMERDSDGTQNPLWENGTGLEKAYAWGRSQSGRFLRELVYRGFNQDEHGHCIFDGIFPHVSGRGRVSLNYRFAQPDRHPRQHEDHLYPSDQFPTAYVSSTDPFTGQTDAILKRPETDPVVIHTQTSTSTGKGGDHWCIPILLAMTCLNISKPESICPPAPNTSWSQTPSWSAGYTVTFPTRSISLPCSVHCSMRLIGGPLRVCRLPTAGFPPGLGER